MMYSRRNLLYRIVAVLLLVISLSSFALSSVSDAMGVIDITEEVKNGELPLEEAAEGSFLIPDWVTNLLNKLDDVIQNFKDLMSGKLIKDAITGMTVLLVDEALSPLYDAFAKGFLFTPQIAEIDGVKGAWSVFMIIGMAALFIAILWMAIKVLRGRSSLKTLLVIFIGSFVLNFLSLTILNILNVGVNMATQSMLQGALGTSGIMYQALDGQQLLKALIVGTDGITDPTYAAQTLGQLVAEMPGGVFMLIAYSLIIVLPFFLLIVAKQFVLILLVILIPGWITQTAFTGKYETMIGYGNLYIRSLIVGGFCALYWAIFVQQQSQWSKGEGFLSGLGVPPVIIAIITGIGLLVGIYFFWIKPIFKAIKSPVTLNGANVMDGLSNFGLKGSEVMSSMGKRFGSEGLQKQASNLQEASNNLKERAERLQNQRDVTTADIASRATGGASESLQGLEYVEPANWIREGSDITVVDENNVELGTSKTMVSSVKMHEDLTEEGFQEGTVIHINTEDREAVNAQMDDLEEDQREGIRWNSQTGKLFIPSHAENMFHSLEHAGIDISAIQESLEKDGLTIDVESGKPLMVEESKAAQKALKTVEKTLPFHTETNLAPDVSQQMYKELSARSDEFKWASDLMLEGEKLWIPKDHAEDIQHVMEQMVSKLTTKSRLNFPKNSQFSHKMIEEWKENPEMEWANHLELYKDGSHVYVLEKHKDLFKKAYDEYRKEKIPFWRSKDGKAYTISDGEVIDYGQPPLGGLDMGSIEAYKIEMQHRHAAEKKKNKAKQSPEKKG